MQELKNTITINPQIRSGKPTIRGMRITVGDILGWLGSGMSVEEIVSDFPELTREDILCAMQYAAMRENRVEIVYADKIAV